MIKIAVLKPHHGPVGGFERVVSRVEGILTEAGYDVTRHTVDMTAAPTPHAWADPADATRRELTNYLYGRDRFDGISTSVYDLVLSTSPPSYVHRHRAHLALFYHHHRVFYDLEDLFVEAGFTADAKVHHDAARQVRSLDADRLAAVRAFLCPSRTVAGRLERFNGRTDTNPFQAGVGVGAEHIPDSPVEGTHGALCVTRHEFPKRTELFVAAAHLVPPTIPMHCTGTGGRLTAARELDHRLSTGAIDLGDHDARSLWCHTGEPAGLSDVVHGRIDFAGHVSDSDLERLYAQARCVVAPAYDEDYGLTAIEAMLRARPVIVCGDGGGLAELVDDGETGLVVEPEPQAIAAAITRLHEDTGLAGHLGRNGRDRARELTWAAASTQLLDAVAETLDTAGR